MNANESVATLYVQYVKRIISSWTAQNIQALRKHVDKQQFSLENLCKAVFGNK